LARQGFEVVQGPQPAVEDDLRNRGVLADFDGSPHPTLFGLLAFGNQPQSAPKPATSGSSASSTGATIKAPKGSSSSKPKDVSTSRWIEHSAGRGVSGVRESRRCAAEGHPAATASGRSGSHRERRGSPRLRNHRIQGVVRGVLRPGRDHESGALPNHITVAAVRTGGRTRSRNEQIANYMLNRQYMEKRPRLAGDAQRHGGIQRHGTGNRHDEDSRFVTVRFRLPPHGRRDLPSRQ